MVRFSLGKHRRGLFGDRSLREGVKAYQAAELDEQMARMKHLSGGELMKIAMGGHAAETVSPVSRLLTVRSR